MHEMGIADAMLRMADRIVREEGLDTVVRITVEIGDLSGVLPRFLENCWEAVRAGTSFEDTVLDIVTVPGTLRCEACGRIFQADPEDLRCPDCGDRKLTPLSGRDMTILQIEAH